MKVNIFFISISLFLFSTISACSSIEGEPICGIWNANGEYGQMKIEITPWQGKFHGYLLEYKNGKESIKGAKKDEFIFLTDLVFQENQYNNGKIYLDPNSEESCGITLEMIDANKIKAHYDCGKDGKFQELWIREGTGNPLKNAFVKTETHTNQATKIKETNSTKNSNTIASNNQVPSEDVKSTPQSSSEQVTEIANTYTTKDFYVIGYAEQVDYTDLKATASSVESLWNKLYNKDFSTQLNNLSKGNNAYVIYSNYDEPKGKMTITIGYRVTNLNSIPSGLNGVEIPSNDYLVYPLSGKTSDYEGEGWNQLEEMMAYRKPESADFEVYTFDANYEVTKANIWIATK